KLLRDVEPGLEAVPIHEDEPPGGFQDFPRRAVVPREHDRAGVRKELVELEYVLEVGAPESIDALVVIPHDDQIPVDRREASHDLELNWVRVLELVHENVPVALLEESERRGALIKNLEREGEKIPEIGEPP